MRKIKLTQEQQDIASATAEQLHNVLLNLEYNLEYVEYTPRHTGKYLNKQDIIVKLYPVYYRYHTNFQGKTIKHSEITLCPMGYSELKKVEWADWSGDEVKTVFSKILEPVVRVVEETLTTDEALTSRGL